MGGLFFVILFAPSQISDLQPARRGQGMGLGHSGDHHTEHVESSDTYSHNAGRSTSVHRPSPYLPDPNRTTMPLFRRPLA